MHSLAVRLALFLALNGAGVAQQYSFRHYGAAEGLQNLTILRDICLGAGMNGYLTKPIAPKRLRELIAELSGRS